MDNSSKFEFYRDFMSIEEAKIFGAFLTDNRIEYSLEGAETIIDSSIVGNGLLPKAIIKIAPEDFKVVNAIIKEDTEALPLEILEAHYLNQLDNNELEDIFYNQEGWTIEDIYTAKKILATRGVKIKKGEIQALRDESLDIIRQGKTAGWLSITFYSLGIVFGLFISVFFVIIGLGMSYYYAYGKSTDVDGNRYFVYDEKTRQIGTVMLFGGITLVIIEILLGTYFVNIFSFF